jgi:hypothetical protein
VGQIVPKFDFKLSLRLRNVPLAPSSHNSMLPVFEAVSNSIHGIQDRFPADASQGSILIEVLRDKDGDPKGFRVSDNGAGLDKDSYDSFLQPDSAYKARRGGKGVGRLLWLKAFKKTRVDSVFDEAGHRWKRSFKFVADDDDPIDDYSLDITKQEIGTVVELRPYLSEYAATTPKKLDTIARSFVRHFLRDLIDPDGFSIVLDDDGEKIDLRAFFRANSQDQQEANFEVTIGDGQQTFAITHMLVQSSLVDQDLKENALYLTGHGRAVVSRGIDRAIGLTKVRGGLNYIGIVEGPFLDEHVNQERTAFTFGDRTTDDIVREAARSASAYLSEDTENIRRRQTVVLERITSTYPRFMATIGDAEAYARRLPLSSSDEEEIYVHTSRQWLREHKARQRQIHELKSASAETIGEEIEKLRASVTREAEAALAEYMVERRVILDLFDSLLAKIRETGSYPLEAQLHELICPMGESSDHLTFEHHNLWILDERLPFYTYFNSDLAIKKQTEGESGKEPDIVFYTQAHSFQRKNSAQPIMIVEFKRPGRDDYTLEKNPIVQSINYINDILNGKLAKDSNGKVVSWISDATPFFVYVVADVTPTLKKVIDTLGVFRATPDNRGHWGFHPTGRAYIEILPYDKVVDAAEDRHKAFFKKLGLNKDDD